MIAKSLIQKGVLTGRDRAGGITPPGGHRASQHGLAKAHLPFLISLWVPSRLILRQDRHGSHPVGPLVTSLVCRWLRPFFFMGPLPRVLLHPLSMSCIFIDAGIRRVGIGRDAGISKGILGDSRRFQEISGRRVRIHFSHLSMTHICHTRSSLTPRRPQPVHRG